MTFFISTPKKRNMEESFSVCDSTFTSNTSFPFHDDTIKSGSISAVWSPHSKSFSLVDESTESIEDNSIEIQDIIFTDVPGTLPHYPFLC